MEGAMKKARGTPLAQKGKAVCCWLLGAALMLPGAAWAQGGSEQGSWGQISQALDRPADWKPLAGDTAFTLGEKTEIPPEGRGAVEGALYTQRYGFYPSLDGSTVCVPLAMELARQLLDMDESDLKGFVSFSTTHFAYERLIGKRPNPTVTIPSQGVMMEADRPVDVLLGTEPSQEELDMAAQAGVELVKTPICYDAFVFLVNAANPVKDLTLEEIRDIYVGKVMNWSALGDQDVEIIPFQREPNSGSQTAMENLVMKGVPMPAAMPNCISGGMGDLVAQVGNYDNGGASLGYSYLYYLENLYPSEAVRVLSIGGVAPTPENLRSGKYPLTTCYYAVYRKGEDLGEAFAQWLQSPVGQACVKQAGYVPYGE